MVGLGGCGLVGKAEVVEVEAVADEQWSVVSGQGRGEESRGQEGRGRGTVPFSLGENRGSPQVVSRPPLSTTTLTRRTGRAHHGDTENAENIRE